MKDDLVDGRETLRLDDLERLEMTAVQLDEARNLLDRGTVSHARLAFILLDNAAEVIMRRNAEVELAANMLLERIRDRWEEILADDPGDAEARRHHDEVHDKIVPERVRRELSRNFDASVDFIRDRGGIQETEARVLKKLHWYRNELYHRDRPPPGDHPVGVPAVLRPDLRAVREAPPVPAHNRFASHGDAARAPQVQRLRDGEGLPD